MIDAAIHPKIQALIDDFTEYLQKFESVQGAELQKIIRQEMINAMASADYDITNKFNLRVAYGYVVEAKMNPQYNLDIRITHKIDSSKQMVDREGENCGITIGEIVEIMNSGRGQYTITPNEKNVLVIPDAEGNYSNNGKVYSAYATIPSKPGTDMFARVQAAIDTWIRTEEDRINDYYGNRIITTLQEVMGEQNG